MSAHTIAALFAPAVLMAQGAFTERTIPTANSAPHCVVSDSRGRIWYAGFGVNQVGVYDPSTDQFRELVIPTANSRPHGIATGPGDSIWFTEQNGNKIGRVDPATFEITEFPVPSPGSSPHTPIWDGRGAIWFTEQNGNRIGRLTIATGSIEEFPIPTPNSGPYGIIPDAAGNAWFCSFGAGSDRIGRVDAATGQITEFRTPTPNSGPRRPWIDSRGRIWITLNRAHKIAVFDPATSRFREFDTPSRNGEPYGVVVDRKDQVWYNEFAANTIVRFDPAAEAFTVFPNPGPRALIRILAVDPSDRVWYGNNGNSRIGLIVPGTFVVNSASFQAGAPLAPGAIVSLFGANLAASTQQPSALPLPTVLGGVSVSFGGAAAPLFFVSPGQINAQVPPETPPGDARVEVRRGDLLTMTQTVRVAAAAPGIFTTNQQGSGPGVVTHAEDFRLVTESSPARPGEFVAIFATGLGRIQQNETASRPVVTIAGLAARVSFSGLAPGFVGLYQINVEVPAAAPSGAQPLRLTQDGAAANPVTVAIR